ncbi:MAG TPA: hypothetical protein VEW69_11585, partial [Alphaproteobacteria bacterium]|nr:hypothetical protein [Alphaproteobacteria bacterium]
MTIATMSLSEVSEFWRTARRLYVIYAALDRTFEIGLPPCSDLEATNDRSEPEVLERVRGWFDEMDGRVQVWQIRQLLQSTNLQTEENLRGLILRHLHKSKKTEADRDKIDFLMVQYYAHCAPPGLLEEKITLEEVAQVLEPALGVKPAKFPDWAKQLNEKIEKLNQSGSLEELQDSGALVEVRELKEAGDDRYFDPACLVAFTRFNFLARRAFFRAMHLDLHAIRDAMAELENQGHDTVDCTEAGLSDNETLEHIRHLVHQWKTPFRAPYTGGSSFMQLVQMRQALERALSKAHSGGVSAAIPAAGSQTPAAVSAKKESAAQQSPAGAAAPSDEPKKKETLKEPAKAKVIAMPVPSAAAPAAAAEAKAEEGSAPPSQQPAPSPMSSEESDFLSQCVADLTAQLTAQKAPVKVPSVS